MCREYSVSAILVGKLTEFIPGPFHRFIEAHTVTGGTMPGAKNIGDTLGAALYPGFRVVCFHLNINPLCLQ